MTAGGTELDRLRNRGPGGHTVSWESSIDVVNSDSYLNGLGIKLQTLFFVGEELLNILALIALKLDHLSHLSVDDDGAIASYRTMLAAV